MADAPNASRLWLGRRPAELGHEWLELGAPGYLARMATATSRGRFGSVGPREPPEGPTGYRSGRRGAPENPNGSVALSGRGLREARLEG
jgi:hypothetical protein